MNGENVARYEATQAGSLCYIGFPDYRAVSQNHSGSYRREPALATRRLKKYHWSLDVSNRGPKGQNSLAHGFTLG
jgi:hypothetical protein